MAWCVLISGCTANYCPLLCRTVLCCAAVSWNGAVCLRYAVYAALYCTDSLAICSYDNLPSNASPLSTSNSCEWDNTLRDFYNHKSSVLHSSSRPFDPFVQRLDRRDSTAKLIENCVNSSYRPLRVFFFQEDNTISFCLESQTRYEIWNYIR